VPHDELPWCELLLLLGHADVTVDMLEAMRSVLDQIPPQHLDDLIERAIACGHADWLVTNLADYVDRAERPLVPGGFVAVRATATYVRLLHSDGPALCLRNLFAVLREWLDDAPARNRIAVASLALAQGGTGDDAAWWATLRPSDPSATAQWENHSRSSGPESGRVDTHAEGVHLDLTEALKPGIVLPVADDGHSDTPDYLCVLKPMQIV
jgi:hypothetical protein